MQSSWRSHVAAARGGRSAVLALACVGLGCATLSQASASADSSRRLSTSAAHTRFVPLAGSAKALVYEKLDSAKEQTQYLTYPSSVIRVLTPTGRHEALGQAGSDPQISLVGSTLVIANPPPEHNGAPTTSGIQLRWWNLSTGKHGSTHSKRGFDGAMPGGWLYPRYEGGVQHVIGETFAGKLTDLGNPIPLGASFGVVSGPDGFLAVSNDTDDDGNGAVVYTPYAHPSKAVTLVPATSSGAGCGGLSATYAACVLDNGKQALLPLNGAKATERKPTCGDVPLVFKRNLVWLNRGTLCRGGQLGELTKSGSVHYSGRTFEQYNMTVALGKIVVTTNNQRELLTLSSVTAKPKVLLK